jgi:uroporphyrinogen-III synthase
VTKTIDNTAWHGFIAPAIQNSANSLKKRLLNIITLASADALESLKPFLSDDRVAKLLTFVVASDRIAKKVAEYNVKEILVVGSAANESVIRAIKNLEHSSTECY